MSYFLSSGIITSGSFSSALGVTAVGTPNRSALTRAKASGLLLTTRAMFTTSESLKYLIRFSQFVPLPDTKIAIFILSFCNGLQDYKTFGGIAPLCIKSLSPVVLAKLY